MRRRRHKLQVSTFPFLAVLLCAMGSLILLLLVIDRRAKVVARTKALEALQKIEAEENRKIEAHRAEGEARRADWERRRQALHEDLTRQDKIEEARRKLRREQGIFFTLQDRVQAESGLIAKDRADLSARKKAEEEKAHMTEASRKELARLTSELVQMERALAELKEARQ